MKIPGSRRDSKHAAMVRNPKSHAAEKQEQHASFWIQFGS
jgi:hypothetical protein